jgi:hypothetical protein
LRKKGSLVIIGSEPTSQNTLPEYKNKLIKELVVKYLSSECRAGSKIYTHPGAPYKEVLQKSKFKSFEEHFYNVELLRSVDEIAGQLFCIPWASKKILGTQAQEFESS